MEDDTWSTYGKLVLKELETLNKNYEQLRLNIDERFNQISEVLSDFKTTEKIVSDQKGWIEKVNDVWSPIQMKEAKDEIYKQKNKWIATIAIITFIEIIVTMAIALWNRF